MVEERQIEQLAERATCDIEAYYPRPGAERVHR